jgi:hypothetical protein
LLFTAFLHCCFFCTSHADLSVVLLGVRAEAREQRERRRARWLAWWLLKVLIVVVVVSECLLVLVVELGWLVCGLVGAGGGVNDAAPIGLPVRY